MFSKLDNYVTEFYQKAYTNLWNYTGITKGLISFVAIVIVINKTLIESFTEPSFWNTVVVIFVMFLTFTIYKEHTDQSKGHYKELNKEALNTRTNPFDRFARILILSSIVIAFILIIYQEPYVFIFIIKYISAVTYLYLDTVLISDREILDRKSEFNYGGV